MTRELTEHRKRFIIYRDALHDSVLNPMKAMREGRIALVAGKPVGDSDGKYIPLDTRKDLEPGVPNPRYRMPIDGEAELRSIDEINSAIAKGSPYVKYAGFLEEYVEGKGTCTFKMEDVIGYVDEIIVEEDFDIEGIRNGDNVAIERAARLMRDVIDLHGKLYGDCHEVSMDDDLSIRVTLPGETKLG